MTRRIRRLELPHRRRGCFGAVPRVITVEPGVEIDFAMLISSSWSSQVIDWSLPG